MFPGPGREQALLEFFVCALFDGNGVKEGFPHAGIFVVYTVGLKKALYLLLGQLLKVEGLVLDMDDGFPVKVVHYHPVL